MKLRPLATGLAFAALSGGLHLCWAALVALGWAQPLLDYVFRLHFIEPVYVVRAFDLGTAALLVAFTGGVGFVGGLLLAVVWNLFRVRIGPKGLAAVA